MAGLETEAEFVMVRIRTLWCLLGMAGWRQYYYCTNCRRPYCKSEIRTGEMVQASDTSYAPSLHCASCDQSVHQPSSFASQGMMISVLMIGFWSGWPGNRTALLVIEILLVITALLLAKSSLSSSQKCKAIYDRWVMQHGTDPYNWPAATQPG